MKIEKIADKMVYSEQSFTKRLLFSEEKVLNFILNLMPEQEIPPHRHEDSDLILHVLTGGGSLTVDDNTQSITSGDVIYCVGEEEFSLKNNSNENLSCFVVIAPRPIPKIYAEEIKDGQ
jgi:quercetin dioxygenase-like cupin family protein